MAMNDPANRPWPHGDEEPNESIERENYEISNSLGNCPNCGARMADQTSGSCSRVIVALHNNRDLTLRLRAVTDRLEAVLRFHGATEPQIVTHPDLSAARELLERLKP